MPVTSTVATTAAGTMCLIIFIPPQGNAATLTRPCDDAFVLAGCGPIGLLPAASCGADGHDVEQLHVLTHSPCAGSEQSCAVDGQTTPSSSCLRHALYLLKNVHVRWILLAGSRPVVCRLGTQRASGNNRLVLLSRSMSTT